MTEPNRSMTEVPGLIEERRKYEGWLAALNARTDAPRHVFDRVKADYETRLRRVQEELVAHRHAIEEERVSLTSRRSLVEADEQLRRDERAELELRLHVGEIAGDESDTAFRVVDEALEHLVGEKDALSNRISDLEMLLETKPPAPASPVEDKALPVAADASHPPADATAAVEPPSTAAEVVAVPNGAADTGAVAGADSSGVAARAEGEGRTVTPSTDAPKGDDQPLRERGPRHTPGGSFDELAFLSNLVGDGSASAANGNADPAESLLAGLGEPGTRRSGERPLASNIPGHTPIVLRTTGAAETVKTLKCTECGAMNYATEWYCERCGAELAAL
jgi:hypothetical protein